MYFLLYIWLFRLPRLLYVNCFQICHLLMLRYLWYKEALLSEIKLHAKIFRIAKGERFKSLFSHFITNRNVGFTFSPVLVLTMSKYISRITYSSYYWLLLYPQHRFSWPNWPISILESILKYYNVTPWQTKTEHTLVRTRT